MENHWWPFKVGDRVRVRRCAIGEYVNRPGTIVSIKIYDDIAVGYMVDIDGAGKYSFYDYHQWPLSVEFLDEEKQRQHELKILMDKPVGDRFKHWTPKDYEIILSALRSMVRGEKENLNEEQRQRAEMLLEEVDKYMKELKGIKSII